MQLVRFVNKKNQKIEFSHRLPTLLVEIEGLSGLEASEVSYSGYMQDGEFYQHSSFDKRQVSIRFHLICESETALLELRTFIHQVFNPKLGDGELYYYHKGVERKINCVADGLPLMSLRSRSNDCSGEIILLAHDPFLLDVNEQKVDIALWERRFKFPLCIPQETGMIMGARNPSLIANVKNRGDVECGMSVEFIAKGEVVNPSLINVNTQEYIKINRTMVAGEKIIVSTGYSHKKIMSELNGESVNIMNYLDLSSTFLQLEVGDNLFRYDAEDNLNQLEINIRYTQRYLGV